MTPLPHQPASTCCLNCHLPGRIAVLSCPLALLNHCGYNREISGLRHWVRASVHSRPIMVQTCAMDTSLTQLDLDADTQRPVSGARCCHRFEAMALRALMKVTHFLVVPMFPPTPPIGRPLQHHHQTAYRHCVACQGPGQTRLAYVDAWHVDACHLDHMLPDYE